MHIARSSMHRIALLQPGGLERFVTEEEAAQVRAVLPRTQVYLGTAAGVAAARALLGEAEEQDRRGSGQGATLRHGQGTEQGKGEGKGEAEHDSPHRLPGFVAKNLLRPRTGSGVTQGRQGSGGEIVSSMEELRLLLDNEERRGCYILYPRVLSRTHDATIVHNGTTHCLTTCHGHGNEACVEGPPQGAVSEIASYGVFLTDAAGTILTNAHAGFGVRTRPASPRHALASALGYGALSCLAETAEDVLPPS